jgi:hypothetical protein
MERGGDIIKMLTPTDKRNLNNLEKLTPNHKGVFKHRIKKKCNSALKDIEFVARNCEKFGFKIDKILNINQLTNLILCYEKLALLQNV